MNIYIVPLVDFVRLSLTMNRRLTKE